MSVAVHAPCGDVGQSKSARSPRRFDSSSSGLSLRGRTAQIVNGKLVLVGDGKSSSNEAVDDADDDVEDRGDPLEVPEIAGQSRTDQEAPRASTSRSPTPGSSKARPKPVRRNTRYFCTWEGCSKSYAKPGRLAEHARSHTGERPFKCTQEGCTASYLRDTHLVAHMRTHLDEKDKPFTCSAESCEKKFWTNQHLNRHVKLVHEQDNAYKCEQCEAAFNKHNKLREHVARDHMPEGTKPYICPEEGCGKSFRTGSKLRTHSKVHDQNRYVCMHPSHLAARHQSELRNGPAETAMSGNAEDYEEDEEAESSQQTFPKFATWSALQEHNKLEHPPTCPHPECDGRIFKSNKKLRKHCIKVHLETIGHTEDEGDTGTADETDHHDGGDKEKIQDLELGGMELASIESGRSIAREESHCVSQQEVEAQTPFAASLGEKESASYSSSFGGRERKRKAGPSPTPRIIPMQSIPFETFDGSGDYSCDANDTGVNAAQRQDKRVRFV